jgi:hypothetical protein
MDVSAGGAECALNGSSNFGREPAFAEDNADIRRTGTNIVDHVGLSGVSGSICAGSAGIGGRASINSVANTADSDEHTGHNNAGKDGWCSDLGAATNARVIHGGVQAALYLGGLNRSHSTGSQASLGCANHTAAHR